MLYILFFIVGSLLFSFVFAIMMYKLENQTSSLDEIENFSDNRICSKFDDDEVAIDETYKYGFKLLDDL